MGLNSNFLDKLASKWLKKQDQFKALKEIGQRGDWKVMAAKCHAKLSIEYKFWILKADTAFRNTKLEDLTKDVAFINKVETKTNITLEERQKLEELVKKYNLK